MDLNPDIAHPFPERIRRTISDLGMIRPGDRILIGISGGPDSMALARVLMILEKPLCISLHLAHLNHCLRGEESDRDETFVREFALEHDLDLTVERTDVAALSKKKRISLEEAGRTARYDFFGRIAGAENCSVIALGHHRDDHVEQVLMNLIRGAGPGGLTGIPPKRGNKIIRPLIRVSKQDILSFLSDIGQDFVTDASNADTTFLRNRVRHTLMPLLEEEFSPEIRSGLDRLSRIMTREDDFLEATAAKALEDITTLREDNAITLGTQGLLATHPALAARILRQALLSVKQDLRRITLGHIDDILEFSRRSEPGKSLDLPGQIRVYKEKATLTVKKEHLPLRTLGRQEKKRRP